MRISSKPMQKLSEDTVEFQIWDLTGLDENAGFYYSFPSDEPAQDGETVLSGPYPSRDDATCAAIGFAKDALTSFSSPNKEKSMTAKTSKSRNAASGTVLKFKRIQEQAVLPKYETTGAAGMDIRACLDGPVRINPQRRVLIPTGIAAEIPEGYELQVRPRSGLAAKFGVTVLNAPGTIDADYRGEIKVCLYNAGGEHINIADGDRIAQLVLAKVERLPIEEAQELSSTERGDGGFGSTGGLAAE